MPDSFIPYGSDPATIGRRQATAKRTMTRDSVTSEFHYDEVTLVDRRVPTFRGAGATFAIPGNAALAQPLWSIENPLSTGIIVAVRDLFVWSFAGAASATIFTPPWAYTFRTTTMPTGGTTFTKASKDSRDSGSHASVIARQGASADGTASVITAPFVAPRLTQRPVSTWASMVGFANHEAQDLLESTVDNEILLQPGQALVVHGNAMAAADNAATRRWFVDFSWQEFTEF